MEQSTPVEWKIKITRGMSESEWIDELEKATAVLHKLLEVGLHRGKCANHPDYQAVHMAAGHANVALYTAKAIATGTYNPKDAQAPTIQ